jgi:hypothetical protein
MGYAKKERLIDVCHGICYSIDIAQAITYFILNAHSVKK